MAFADYRTVALISLVVVLALIAFRRYRFRSMPSGSDCLRAAFNVLSLMSAMSLAVVFLLTDPPAIELLSKPDRGIAGLVIVIAVGNLVGQDLLRLFNPDAIRLPPPEARERQLADED